MSYNKILANILKQVKENQWYYPKTFEALKDAGVRSYTVKIGDDYEALYQGIFGEWKEVTPKDFKPTKTAGKFSESEVIQAIIRHTKEKKTTFVELLSELSKAGVSHYVVDMQSRTIKYYSPKEDNYHKEIIPNL